MIRIRIPVLQQKFQCYSLAMKRAFAIVIVVLVAVAMIGTLIPGLVGLTG